MKKLRSVLTLLAIAFSFQTMIGTDLQPNEFVITGELVGLGYKQSQEQDFYVKITHSREETGIRELVSGKFENRRFELRGTIELPLEVSLRVLAGETKVGSRKFLLHPNFRTKIEVEVINSDYYQVFLKGYEHASTNSERKFSFTGDISELGDYHRKLTEVFLDCVTYELDGSETYTPFSNILLDNGKFSIEGDIEGPTGVFVEFQGSNSILVLTAIFEPGVNYELGTVGNSEEIVVVADREGFHSKLITDWKSDPEYLELLQKKNLAFEKRKTTRHSEAKTDKKLEVDLENNEELTIETPTISFAASYPPAPECQHVDLNNVPADIETGLARLLGYYIEELEQQLDDKRIEFLLPYIQNENDLQLAWLAFLLSPLDGVGYVRGSNYDFLRRSHFDNFDRYDYSYTYNLQKQILAVVKELATKFSQEFVTKHITERINLASKIVSDYENDIKLMPGQPAPPFTLLTKDGNSVSLHDVLQKNELVLVNFWDRNCGSCIASIPALEEMHSTYHADGFEIIVVHLTNFTYSRRHGIEHFEFPWIDVSDSDNSDPEGSQSPIVTSYTQPRRWRLLHEYSDAAPNGFLIDGEGCIIQRYPSTEKLEKILASRWSEESAE